MNDDKFPHTDLLRAFAEHYPRLPRLDKESWDADVAAESAQP